MALPVSPVPLDRTPPSADVSAPSASETLPAFPASVARGAGEEEGEAAEAPEPQPLSAARGAEVAGSPEEEEEMPTVWADGANAIPFEAMPKHTPPHTRRDVRDIWNAAMDAFVRQRITLVPPPLITREGAVLWGEHLLSLFRRIP